MPDLRPAPPDGSAVCKTSVRACVCRWWGRLKSCSAGLQVLALAAVRDASARLPWPLPVAMSPSRFASSLPLTSFREAVPAALHDRNGAGPPARRPDHLRSQAATGRLSRWTTEHKLRYPVNTVCITSGPARIIQKTKRLHPRFVESNTRLRKKQVMNLM